MPLHASRRVPAGRVPDPLADRPTLRRAQQPADLRRLPTAELPVLCAEIRQLLIETVAATGGHLGPNLGIVELTVALHRVFDSPREPILFDVGHQAYVHKILTGRAAAFASLRREGGLSGYPNRAESEHDWLENSHASVALSYADGLAKAYELAGDPRPVTVVVGDGALTGGLCWEALNNIAGSDRPVIVVLNDNGRSYEPTVGGFGALLGGPAAADPLRALGFEAIGPVDGHDVPALERALQRARAYGRPCVVHCITRKGNGYGPARERVQDLMHQTPPFEVASGASLVPARRWTDVLASHLVTIGERRPDVVAVTAAMRHPTGLAAFADRFPGRCFDVGIAEQHAVASAAGMAMGGHHPVVALYATFANRAFDQVLMDLALHRLPATLVLDRAGLTGEDGPSHHGMWDLALLGGVPGVRIAAPRDAWTLCEELDEAVEVADGPTVVRFPKAAVGPSVPAVRRIRDVDVLAEPHQGPVDVLLVAVGAVAETCCRAAGHLAGAGLTVRVVDPRWVVPVSDAMISAALESSLVVTVEDGVVSGGAGTRLAERLRAEGIDLRVRHVGLPNRFVTHGSVPSLAAAAGLSPEAIADRVAEWSCDLGVGVALPVTSNSARRRWRALSLHR